LTRKAPTYNRFDFPQFLTNKTFNLDRPAGPRLINAQPFSALFILFFTTLSPTVHDPPVASVTGKQ
jgi:hypothetical protein